MPVSSSLPSRALTVKQPWAELIVAGRKPLEIRSWATPHRGPFCIHAGKATETWAATNLAADEVAAYNGRDFTAGAIVGTATLAGVRPFLEADAGVACRPWSPGLLAWVLTDHHRLPQPVPMPGALGLWRLPLEFP